MVDTRETARNESNKIFSLIGSLILCDLGCGNELANEQTDPTHVLDNYQSNQARGRRAGGRNLSALGTIPLGLDVINIKWFFL